MTTAASDTEQRAGFIAAASAYTFWGILPIYLRLVGFADASEVLAQRILWCVPAALAAVLVMERWGAFRVFMRPRTLGLLALSAIFIFFNWGIYVWAVANDRLMEAALAYFIAPMVNVALGVLLFNERLTRGQAVAMVFATLGVVLQGVALGAAPWVSLALCTTWCAYGLVRKQVEIGSATGLFVETLWLVPVAAAVLIWVTPHAAPHTGGENVLLALLGPITAFPLMLFAFGARRLPFATLGLLQFLAPSIQFALGLLYGEPFTPLRAVSFALIWAGLAAFSWDALRRDRTQ